MDFERDLHGTDIFTVHSKMTDYVALVIVTLAFGSGFSKVFAVVIYACIYPYTYVCIHIYMHRNFFPKSSL